MRGPKLGAGGHGRTAWPRCRPRAGVRRNRLKQSRPPPGGSSTCSGPSSLCLISLARSRHEQERGWQALEPRVHETTRAT